MQNARYYFIIFLLSLLPFITTFVSPDLPHTSDGGVQLPRIAAYYKSLSDFQIPVRWAGDLNFGYGMPLFNFMYQLPYLIASIFVAVGFSLVWSFKISLYLSFLFSGIFMFLFINELTNNKFKALFVSIFYLFAPFRLVELLVRGAFGGVFSYTFIPLVLYGLVRVSKKPDFLSLLIIAISTSLLILSHNSLSLAFFILAGIFTIFISPCKKALFYSSGALFAGLLLSSFYWIPAIAEHKYTYGDLFMKDMYLSHFPPLVNFFIPNLNNAESLRTAEISVQFGIFHSLSIITAIYILLKKKINGFHSNKLFAGSLILIVASIILMQKISVPLWQNINLLRQFQFPWRLIAIVAFLSSFLSLSFFSVPKIYTRKILLIIAVLAVISTIYYWRPPQGFQKVNESDFWNYPLNTTYFGETDVIWTIGEAKEYPEYRIEPIAGTATISDIVLKTQKHTFSVNAQTDSKIVDRTVYFPGWQVYIDGTKTPIEFQDQNYRGMITFAIPKGQHEVTIVFGESKIRLLADCISLIAATTLLMLYLLRKKIYL